MTRPEVPPLRPSVTGYRIEFIAGGVVKNARGDIVDDTSEREAKARLKREGLPNLMEKGE
jgi:hypothetical protein